MLTALSAGIRDSPLTNHGVLQASRLGSHLASTHAKISHIFSSDLQRASKTAEAIRNAQSTSSTVILKSGLLREQDFGYYEGRPHSERLPAPGRLPQESLVEKHRNGPGFRDVESKESMRVRMETFVNSHLLEHFVMRTDDETVAVVAHGIILTYLWRCILQRFNHKSVLVAPDVNVADRGMVLQHLGFWSNTGYLDLDIKQKRVSGQAMGTERGSKLVSELREPTSLHCTASVQERLNTSIHPLPSLSLVVKAVNSQEHLRGLKKTRGGIGSMKHDGNQKTMDAFVKRRKVE
jgi:broad specificity phosphatase PhoE